MNDWERAVDSVGPLRIIAALGALFVSVGVAQSAFLLGAGRPVDGAIIDFVLLGGPGLALLYGAYRIPDTDVDPAAYPRIVFWSLSGMLVLVLVVVLLVVNPSGEITRPLRAAVMAAGFGAVGGFPVGWNEARAIARAREAEQRSRELERTRAKLEETVDRLEESNERLEQFAYAASHDLQEPLRMVSSYLRLIENQYGDELDGDGQEYIEFAVDGADRMREMIEALLQYSRVESQGAPFEPVHLDDVVSDVLDDLQVKIESRDADVAVDPLPRVQGDERQLRQVFQNLLSNAIEYSDDEPPKVHVSAERDGEDWTVAVSDEGIGIDPEDADRIFEVFQSLHSQHEHSGTGIGLALCKRIVERHGGDIWVDSEPGEGSTFYFTLPGVDYERTDRSVDPTSPSADHGK